MRLFYVDQTATHVQFKFLGLKLKTRKIRIIHTILFRLIEILQPYFPKNAYILTDNLYEEHAGCIDTYSLFCWLRDNGYEAYYVLWEKNPLYKKLKKENQLRNIITVKHNSRKRRELLWKLFFVLLKTKYVILSFGHSCYPDLWEFLYKNKFINLVGIGHGPVFLKTSVLSTPYLTPDLWNLYLVSSKYEEDLFIKYGWEKENLFNVGLPRFDLCKREKHEGKNIVFMFTWRLESFVKKSDDLKKSMYYKNFTHLLKNDRLKEFARRNDINIIFSIHHSFKDLCNIEFDLDEHFHIADSNNLIKYINTADLFITDYSSIFHDFMFLNIPVMFYRFDYNDPWLMPLDIEDLENCKQQDSKLFNIFYDESAMLDKIEYYISNNFELEEEYKKIENTFFTQKTELRKTFVEKLERHYDETRV